MPARIRPSSVVAVELARERAKPVCRTDAVPRELVRRADHVRDLGYRDGPSRVEQRGHLSRPNLFSGVRDGVELLVIVDSGTGEIVSGYPTNPPTNPVSGRFDAPRTMRTFGDEFAAC